MIRHYLVLSLKVLRRRAFFTFTSIFGICFTLVVLTIATAVFDHTLGVEKPLLRQDRMLGVRQVTMFGPGGNMHGSGGYKLFDRYARGLTGVEALTIFTGGGPVASYVAGRKIELSVKQTDGAYWSVFDFEFVDGRPYSAAEVDGAQRVAVINQSTRERIFGAQPAVGNVVTLGDQSFRVVGVVENVSVFRIEPFADVWVPITAAQRDNAYRSQIAGGGFWAVALAADRAALPGIRDEFNGRLERAELEDPALYTTIVAPFESRFEFFARELLGNKQEPRSQGWKLVVLLSIVAALFFVLPTVNLVNLNVSRILERASEIGVRRAFGASVVTLVVQFVVENVILTLAGGAIGLAVSAAILRAINQSGVIPYSQLTINARVFLTAVAVAILFGMISGVYPAWRMARLHPVTALKGGATR